MRIKTILATLLVIGLAFSAEPQSKLIPQGEVTFEVQVDNDVVNQADCRAAFHQAMKAWIREEPINSRFRYVKVGEKADYTVRFSTSMGYMGDSVVGWIQHKVTDGRSRGTIAVKSIMNASNPATNYNCLVHVSLHELGHLLGLPDDYKTLGSDSIGMLMGFIDVNKPLLAPSRYDIERVLKANGPLPLQGEKHCPLPVELRSPVYRKTEIR